MENTNSLSQKSQRQPGKIFKGRSMSNPQKQNKNASIPSKFDTLLKTPDEKKGFGSNMNRFDHSGNEVPGPGQYKAHTPQGVQNCRGLTMFASRTKKFKDENKYEVKISLGPGEVIRNDFKLQEEQDQNHIMISGRERPILIDDQFRKLNEIIDHPEPGRYEVDASTHAHAAKRNRNPHAVFIASDKIKRDNLYRHQMLNPHIHHQMPEGGQSSLQQNKFLRGEDWMFKLESERRVPINLYDPVNSVEDRRNQEEFISVPMGNVERQMPVEEPGPGHYQPPLKDINKNFKVTDNNFQFTKNELNRFGELTIRKAQYTNPPGPGNYDVIPESKFKTQAIFDNNVNKGFETQFKPKFQPGPAYYDNSVNMLKKNYHFNVNQQWEV